MKWFPGLTLRDYFAAKAMQGMLSTQKNLGHPIDMLAKLAYIQADAMLKAREQ